MSLIEEILKYSNKHSRTVIVILLGVILVGSIGGGLWIQNLNAIIAEKDKLKEERLTIQEQTYQNRLASTDLEYRGQNQEIISILNKLEISIKNSTKRMDDAAKDLFDLARSEKLSHQTKSKLSDSSKTIVEYTAELSGNIENARKAIIIEMNPPSNVHAIDLEPPTRTWLSISVFLIFLFVALLLGILFWMIRNSVKRSKARSHLRQACHLLTSSKRGRYLDNYLNRFDKCMAKGDLEPALYELEHAFRELESLKRIDIRSTEFWEELLAVSKSLKLRDAEAKYKERLAMHTGV